MGSACCNEGLFGGRRVWMVIGRLVPVFIPVNIIGDTAIDGMRAMAGYDYLWSSSGGWLATVVYSPFGGC
jgi:hypothetical protein